MASDSDTRRADYQPEGADPKASTFSTLKRTVQEFSEDNLTDWAAALTYYGLLSLFPALIAMVSVMGLVGDPATVTKTITDVVTQLGPKSAADALSGPIKSITSNPTGAGIALIAGLAGALWSASGYVGAFMRASQIIWETPEGRPIWKLRPLQLLVTLVMIVLTAVVALSLVLTGPIVQAVAAPLGLGSTAVTIWDYAKWPVLVLIVLVIIDVLYFAAPQRQAARLRLADQGGTAGARGLADRIGRVRLLRGQLRLVQHDVREPRRSGGLPGLAVDHQRRGAARHGVQRRA